MPEESNDASPSAQSVHKSHITIEPDEALVNQLVEMGFSVNGSRKAAAATHNAGVEMAMGYVLEHMADADFDQPITDALNSAAREEITEEANESIDMICSMGYSRTQAEAALKATDFNLER